MLDDAGRQRFHEEQMLAAELLLVPRELIPPTVPELREWLAGFERRGELRITRGARRVAELFLEPPREAEWRPVLKGVARLAFATLPPGVRELYGFDVGPVKERAARATLRAVRYPRPLLPPRYRYIAPYAEWRARQRGRCGPSEIERARRSVGIRLEEARSLWEGMPG